MTVVKRSHRGRVARIFYSVKQMAWSCPSVWYDQLVMKLTFVPSRNMSTMVAAVSSRLGMATGRT